MPYHQFLTQELVPRIDAQYRTDTGMRILNGLSYGGTITFLAFTYEGAGNATFKEFNEIRAMNRPQDDPEYRWAWFRYMTVRDLRELSPQEQRVLRLLVAGLTNAAIARELVVSTNTVKTQLKSIYRKLDVSNRDEAREAAAELNLL